MRPTSIVGRRRIVVRPVIGPSDEMAVLADEWQRQGRPHFISKRVFQARQRSPVKDAALKSVWAELKEWLFGK